MEGHKLGFLSRAERVLFQNPANNDAEGPGAFNQTQFKTGPENFAPFGSTTKRETRVPVQSTPAPGAYESDDMKMKVGNSNDKTMGILHSKTRRFVPAKPAIGPGPGTYALKPAIKMVKPKKRIEKARSDSTLLSALISAQPTAPSIPNKFQSFGYEEDETGKLKPQASLNPGFSGERFDSVGPGDYDVKPSEKTKVMANFAKGSERIVGQRPSSNPGPGYYNYKSSFESLEDDAEDDGNFYMKMAQAHKKRLSSFVSTTQRIPIEGKVDPHEPGPASYNIPRTGVEIKKKDVRIQCFDSTVTRFTDPMPKSQRIKTHPGSYKPLTSDFDKNRLNILRRKRITARSGWAQNISFACTEKRFFAPEPETLGPAPGHYTVNDGIADLKQKNMRYKPFGSSLKRFTYTGDHEPSYRTQEQEAAFHVYSDEPTSKKSLQPPKKSPVRPSRVFVSNEQRFNATKDIQYTPAPGSYNVSYDWKKINGGGIVPMGERKCKSVVDLTPKMPGPGDYVISTSLHQSQQKTRNRTSGMGGTEKRFNKERHDEGPPPGTYNVEQSLIKPSHNVYMSAQF